MFRAVMINRCFYWYVLKGALYLEGNKKSCHKRYDSHMTGLVPLKIYFISLDTLSLFLPLALLRARIFLPLWLLILSLNPCLFLLFLFDG